MEDVEDVMTETIKDKIRLVASGFPQIKNIHSLYLSNVIVDSNDNNHEYRTTFLESIKHTDKRKDKIQSHLPTPSHFYLDVQMNATLSFDDARRIIDTFEQKIKNEIPSIKQITTHIVIENEVVDSYLRFEDKQQTDSHLLNEIKNASLSVNRVRDCKDIALVNVGSDLHETLTIKIPSYSLMKSKKMRLLPKTIIELKRQ